MGLSCAKRFHPEQLGDEDEWEVVGLEVVQVLPWRFRDGRLVRSNRTFKQLAQKVIRLLRLRRIWSSLGRQLRSTPVHQRRQAASTVFHELGFYLANRRTKSLFTHLQRVKGKLRHR